MKKERPVFVTYEPDTTIMPNNKMTLTWVSNDGSVLHTALPDPSDHQNLRRAEAMKIAYYRPVLDAINRDLLTATEPSLKELHLTDNGVLLWKIQRNETNRLTVDIEGHGPNIHKKASYTSSYLVDMEQRDKVAEMLASAGATMCVNLHANLTDDEIARSVARHKNKPVTFVIDESDSTAAERFYFLSRWIALGGPAITTNAAPV
jgi:hypothetical protein